MIDNKTIASQIQHTLKKTDFRQLGKKYEGKVRDNYTNGGRRILIVTDRLSAFDRVITTIPFKGQVLNQITKFWFEQTSDILANHAIEFPDPNVVIAKECKPLMVEMVVRGYITGVTSTSAWYNYEKGVRDFCGNILPDGMKKNQKFEKPIITPSTKAEYGGHDESVSASEILERGVVTPEQWEILSNAALALYNRGVEVCAKQGIILVDTKYEMGLDEDGNIVLIDEIHTPDSSRFWFANEYEELFAQGKEQTNINKEYLRQWLAEKGFLGDGEVPPIPDDVRVETARRYIEAYELITGREFVAQVEDVNARMTKNLAKYS